MLNHSVFVYLDDVLNFSLSLEEHTRHVKAALWLLENSLFVKAEKCKFHQSSVSFFGYSSGELTNGSCQGLSCFCLTHP